MRGKAEKSTRFVLALREQPRTREEKEMQEGLDRLVDGTTPRVRGKLVSILFHGRGRRNNPACAGKRLHDQRVYRTTIEFSVNFPKPTRTRQEPIASSRNQHVWFVLDHSAQRRGTLQDRQQ